MIYQSINIYLDTIINIYLFIMLVFCLFAFDVHICTYINLQETVSNFVLRFPAFC